MKHRAEIHGMRPYRVRQYEDDVQVKEYILCNGGDHHYISSYDIVDGELVVDNQFYYRSGNSSWSHDTALIKLVGIMLEIQRKNNDIIETAEVVRYKPQYDKRSGMTGTLAEFRKFRNVNRHEDYDEGVEMCWVRWADGEKEEVDMSLLEVIA